MYKAPINFTTNVTESIVEKVARNLDEQIYSAIQKCGVEVNKDELIRALQYDRDQYNAGYEDGVRDTMEEVPRWIPVAERLPEKSGYYLVHHKCGLVSQRLFYDGYPEMFWKLGFDPVTHWMPLPTPPKDGDT